MDGVTGSRDFSIRAKINFEEQPHSTTVLYLSFVNQRRRSPLWALDPTDMKNPDKVLPQVFNIINKQHVRVIAMHLHYT